MIQPSPYPYIFILSAGGDAQQSHCKSCISQSIGFHQVHLRSLRSLRSFGSLRVFQYLPMHQRSINVSWGKKRISIHSSAWQSCVQSRTQRVSTCVFGQGPRHSPALRTTSNLMFEQFELDQENTRNGIAALNFCTGGILCCCACLHLWFAFLSRYPTLWQFGIFMYFRNAFFFLCPISKKRMFDGWTSVVPKVLQHAKVLVGLALGCHASAEPSIMAVGISWVPNWSQL